MALSRWCLAAMLASASLVVPAAALRAQAPVEQAETVSFNIPAGSLVDALTAFQDQSGAPPSGIGSEVLGKQTAGVTGDLPPGEALERLLEGTGLTFLKRDDGGYMIEPLANVRVPGGRCVLDKRKANCREQ